MISIRINWLFAWSHLNDVLHDTKIEFLYEFSWKSVFIRKFGGIFILLYCYIRRCMRCDTRLIPFPCHWYWNIVNLARLRAVVMLFLFVLAGFFEEVQGPGTMEIPVLLNFRARIFNKASRWTNSLTIGDRFMWDIIIIDSSGLRFSLVGFYRSELSIIYGDGIGIGFLEFLFHTRNWLDLPNFWKIMGLIVQGNYKVLHRMF